MFLFLVFLAGASFSGFFQCTMYRIQHRIPVSVSRSFCDECGKTLTWMDPLPFVNYLILRGRCRYCNTKLPIKYFLAETVSGIIILSLFLSYRSILIALPFSLMTIYILSYYLYHRKLTRGRILAYGSFLGLISYYQGGPNAGDLLFSSALVLILWLVIFFFKREESDILTFLLILSTSLVLSFKGLAFSLVIAAAFWIVSLAIAKIRNISSDKEHFFTSSVFFSVFSLAYVFYYSFV